MVASNGDRNGIRNIGIVVSDGQSSDRDATKQEATAMLPEDITLISLGVNVKGLLSDQASKSKVEFVCSSILRNRGDFVSEMHKISRRSFMY